MSQFRKFFDALRAQGKDTFILRGSTLIVEVMDEEELVSNGGIILASDSNQARGGMDEHRLNVARVLMVGDGYVDTDENGKEVSIPCDVEVGAYILLPKYSTQYISIFPGLNIPTKNKIGMVKEGEILAYYPTGEAYEAAKQIPLD